jgi:hypothetical protein
MTKKIDLTGQPFGRLTVIGKCGTDKSRRTIWKCQCICGRLKNAIRRDLESGHTKSCGFYRNDCLRDRILNHGKSDSPEYNIWQLMKNRCLNPKDKSFEHYGGRGITVCDRWLESFENFYVDMGQRPSPNHTLDRIEVNGPYSPNNCQWASQEQQANNTTRNVFISHLNKTQTLAQWSVELEINYKTLNNRYNRGWSIERLFSPVKTKK